MNSYQQTDNNIAPIIKPLEVVGGLFSNYNLEKFKVHSPTSLFQPTAVEIVKALKDKRCPVCNCRIYLLRNGKAWICRSKRKDGFIVKAEVMKKYEERNIN